MGSRLRMSCLIMTVVAMICLPIMAQETTGTIRGTVTDPTGAAIPGATVTATSPSLMGPISQSSNSIGNYRFANIPAGTYTVTVSVDGFRTTTTSAIELEVGRVIPINVSLEVGVKTETVEVTSNSLVIDTTSSKASVNITGAVLNNLPKGRDATSLIALAPGARSEPLMGGFQIDGASDGENSFNMEGMDTTNMQTGGAGVSIPVDFLDTFTVKSSGFEAEHGGAIGGTTNAVMKRGGPAWHGATLLYYRSSSLNPGPRSAFVTDPNWVRLSGDDQPANFLWRTPKEDEWRVINPGFEISGPLVDDKLGFYMSYIPQYQRTGRTIDMADPNGEHTFYAENTTHLAYTRLDWTPTENVRTNFSWLYNYNRSRGSLPGTDFVESGFANGSFTSDPALFRADRGSVNPDSTYVIATNVTVSPTVIVSGRLGLWSSDHQDRGATQGIRTQYIGSNIGLVGLDGTPMDPAFENVNGYSNIGEIRQTVFDVQERTNGSVDVGYTVSGGGTHNLKFGYALNQLANDVRRVPKDAWVRPYWGADYSPVLASGQAACAIIKADLFAAYGVAQGWASAADAPCSGIYGNARVIDISTIGDVSSTNQSIYLQDSWRASDKLTLNLGIRFDSEYLPSFGSFAYLGKAIEFGWGEKIAPRFGGAYDVRGDGTFKIYGSWGYYYDIMKYEMPRGSFGGDYWHDCWYTLDIQDAFQIIPTPTAEAHTCPNTGGVPGNGLVGQLIEEINWRIPANDPSDNTIEPNLKPMKQTELVFGAEYSLSSNMGLELRYVNKTLNTTIEDVGLLSAFGEKYFIANPGMGITEQPFSAGILAVCPSCPARHPKAMRDYEAVEARMVKRLSDGWFFSGSYTYSNLAGNYSGLTSSDESGRHSPNVNRFFDLPNMSFDMHGNVQKGNLVTDRPHTIKMYGSYDLNYSGMSTTIGFNQVVYSGTPVTTQIQVISSTPVMVENRGNVLDVTYDPITNNIVGGAVRRGVRTPGFTQSDISIHQDFRPDSDNESLKVTLEFNITNLMDQEATLRFDSVPNGSARVSLPSAISPDGIDWESFFSGTFDYIANLNAGGASMNGAYLEPNAFQGSRDFRIQLKVAF